jgi:hypothetical protein
MLFFQIFLANCMLLSCIHAFTTPSSATTIFYGSSISSASSLNLFFGKKNDQKKPTTADVKKAADTKKPFVFLYGRPQYDWVRGQPMDEEQQARNKPFDWNAASATRKSK